MDNYGYYSFNEFDQRTLLDEKFHLGRRLTALFLCALFLFPFIFYNLPNINKLPDADSIFSLSDSGEFSYSIAGSKNNVVLNGYLKAGEIQFTPTLSPKKDYHFTIKTENAYIKADNSVYSIQSYFGNDGIYYTHIVCKKGKINLSLFNSKESKVSSDSRMLLPDYEALIYSDNDMVGFVRFEADGSTPRPGHGVYTRKTVLKDDLFEYIEMNPLYYEAFLLKDKYKEPTWKENMEAQSSEDTYEEPIGSPTTTDPYDFTMAFSISYFNAYIPWGEEETLLEESCDDKNSISSDDSSDTNTVVKPALRDMVINDNMKTLGGEVPLMLNTLTVYENFPSNSVIIIGEVYVKSLILISSSGKDESHRIKTFDENKVLPIRNYIRLSKSGTLYIS